MRVAVSFLTSNPDDMTAEKILEKIPQLEEAGADTIQWDLMDGKYNDNNTMQWFTWDVIKQVTENTNLDSEAHLMVLNPKDMVEEAAKYCSLIMFHYEACDKDEIQETIQAIKAAGKKVGIAIEPATPASAIADYLDQIDNVLVMTVKTGYAGQAYIDQAEKIRELKEVIDGKNLNVEIEVDGGISDKTVDSVRDAGATAANSASYILNNDYAEAINRLKGR